MMLMLPRGRVLRFSAVALATVGLLGSIPLAGQERPVRWQDSSVTAVLRGIGPETALRQLRGPLPNELLDAIADSLVQRALRPIGATTADRSRDAQNSISVLRESGFPEGGGVPFARAQAHLIRIADGVEEASAMRSAMRALLAIGSITTATDYLVRRALQGDSMITGHAVGTLYQAWEPGLIGVRPTTAAELAVVRAGLKRIWEGSWPRAGQGVHLPYTVGPPMSRVACLEGWYEPAAACARLAPVMRMTDTLGRGGEGD